MARRRSSRAHRRQLFIGVVIVGIGAGAYYKVFWEPIRQAPERVTEERHPSAMPLASSPRADADSDPGPYGHVPERGATSGATPAAGDGRRALALMKAGFASLEGHEYIDARAKLSEALRGELPREDQVKTRAALVKLADRTLLSAAIIPDDPFSFAHVVQPGEALVKIAKKYDVTPDLLARVNQLRDMNMIRAGQRLKVIRGPFSAVIDRETFDMHVYLQGTFVKHFKVGLGENGGTPSGKWKVRNKLKNPTYYPPRGGDIIAADAPDNPLGERWIGLEGIEGEAIGQTRYGIHGTIEPESIGKNMSLGCVRMHNQDAELLFDLLIEQKSTVAIQ
ncbi:MAG: L,D-transpeptidase family protein [bacterium]|nr:L,D-transpeptidase family protein [bacterium]